MADLSAYPTRRPGPSTYQSKSHTSLSLSERALLCSAAPSVSALPSSNPAPFCRVGEDCLWKILEFVAKRERCELGMGRVKPSKRFCRRFGLALAKVSRSNPSYQETYLKDGLRSKGRLAVMSTLANSSDTSSLSTLYIWPAGPGSVVFESDGLALRPCMT